MVIIPLSILCAMPRDRAESARISLPTADDLLTRAAELVGLPIHGVLNLPFHIKVR